jgi:hypothetical protein
MSIIANTLKLFYAEFLGMSVICLQTTFHMLSSSGSLITTIKYKAKYRFCVVTIFFLHSTKELPELNIYFLISFTTCSFRTTF